MKLQPISNSFASFLKLKREALYRSAREFSARVKTGVSYPQYSRYETGDQLPSLKQALSICSALQVPELETLLEWNKAQLGEAAVQKDLDQLLSKIRAGEKVSLSKPESPAEGFNVPLDKVVVFNRSHRDVFQQHPAYRDIFTYINAFHPEKISVSQMAQALKLQPVETEKMLNKLESLGVVSKQDGLYSASKRNFYFPDDQDFFELRNMNVRHNFDEIMNSLTFKSLASGTAYRGIITREFTASQLKWIAEQSEKLLAQSVGLPEDEGGEAIYSVLTVVGERFRRT
jgi:transcriptional regulator with XRE-family HTH domain